MAEASSESAYFIGAVLHERTKDLHIDAIDGMEIGVMPLTTAAVIGYHLHGRKMEGPWVRDRAKLHGTRKTIEGNLRPGSRVVILDDAITTSGSSGRAISEVKEIGCEVVRVLSLVDRLQGGAKFFQDEGIADHQAIFTIRDFTETEA